MPRVLVAVAAAMVLAAAASGQGPDADWRTVETGHFRVHYPAPAEAWALHVAARLEAIRERVAAEVGYTPSEVTDVVVQDPMAEANGMALPLLGRPRMVLWTTPPPPESAIGAFADWGELVALHEDVHLVHLLRPSRSPVRGVIERLLPLGPITLRAPRWVHEGYATMLEGRLTGAGRPNGDLRAAVIRRWAQLGRLPSYRGMASDDRSWLGMSMAYLVGSAYLEWLEARGGPASLRSLWRRLTARADRSFEEAFEGVFGEGPAELYGRFKAEVTWRALEVERARAGTLREGARFADTEWSTGEPAVAADGARMAIVLRARRRPPRLVVWPTAPDAEAEAKRQEREAEQLERDPEDVAAVRTGPERREPLFELPADGGNPMQPRFLTGGEAIVFTRMEPDAGGFLHPDLFRWDLASGEVRRLTRGADVREADPAPDGTWAVAVRHRWGASQLVRVELATGAISAITDAAVGVVYSAPRVAPDGRRVACVVHRGGRWRLVVRDLASAREAELAVPPDAVVAQPAWLPDGGALVAVLARGGFVDLHAFPVDGGAPWAVTRVRGAALAPAPDPRGGALYYLLMGPDGLEVRSLPAVEPAAGAPEADAVLAPAVRPLPPLPPAPLRTEVLEPQPYRAGRLELTAVTGGSWAPAGSAFELGLAAGDVVGRVSALAVASRGGGGAPSGAALAVAWRGWEVEVDAHLLAVEERPSEQSLTAPGLGTTLDWEGRGGEVAAAWRRVLSDGEIGLRAGGWLVREEREGGGGTRRAAFLSLRAEERFQRGRWFLQPAVAARLDAGSASGVQFERWRGGLVLDLARDDTVLRLEWRRGELQGERPEAEWFRIGGLESSLLPGALMAARVVVPALPAGTLRGDRYEGQRLALHLGGVRPFWERHRVGAGGSEGAWLELAGVELEVTSDALSFVALPGFVARAGVARILDEPFAGRTRGWVGLAWRP